MPEAAAAEALTVEAPSTALIDAAAAEVKRRFAGADCTALYYHNFEHTLQVAKAAELISVLLDLTGEEREDLRLAAWWHDCGMLTEPGNGHEEVSAEMARAWLEEQGHPPERIARVKRLINATRIPHQPTDLLEEAIRDADLSNLGRPEYLDRLENLRREWQTRQDANADLSDDVKWYEENIAFVSGHQYLTSAANKLYGEQKRQNLERLEKKLKKTEKKLKKKAKKAKKKAKKKAEKRGKTAIQSEKSAQVMLKTTLRNNIDLTSIADGKANIMLSISSVILSIGLPVIATYIPQFTYLVVPAGVLLLTCVLTITYATLATRPVYTEGKTKLSDLKSGKTNLFFFGNYYNMGLGDYKEAMDAVLDDQEVLDNSILNDLYWLGVALGHKFNRLRICYGIFLTGMIVSALSFVVAFYFSGPLAESEIVPVGVFSPPADSLGVESSNTALPGPL